MIVSATSASQVVGITGPPSHGRLIFAFLVEWGFRQAGLKLLTSGDPPSSASQNSGINRPELPGPAWITALTDLFLETLLLAPMLHNPRHMFLKHFMVLP